MSVGITGSRAGLLAVMVVFACLLPVLAAADVEEPAPAEAPEAEAEAPVKKIKMYCENYRFIPDMIRVEQGTRVIIDIENRDAPHTFVLKAYGLDVKLPQDETVQVEFVADKQGEFRWKNTRPCGDGWTKMRGKLIVE